jgi:two-component system chemotaxis response regulator CheY
MYSIGELSKIVKISIDALRYYDEIGLLKPYHIDNSNRYRYYSAVQVNEIITIMEWKQYGFSLDAIKELLSIKDPERMQDTFHTRLQQLTVERANIERSMEQLQERIRNMKGDLTMNKKTVLIIDDAAFLRQILQDILEKHGLSVVGAAVDGETGIAMYTEFKPDVIILDIGLPGIDGIEVTKRIMEMDRNAKIVICSARGQLKSVLECLEAGASHFVVKPFLPDILLEILNTTLDEDVQQYNSRTISSINLDTRVEELDGSLPQEIINTLLQFCGKEKIDEAAELSEFWGQVKQLEPTA